MPGLGKKKGKTRMSYADFKKSGSGLQYYDLKLGSGTQPQDGQKVLIDWSGYTIGYYGRPFEAKNKPKGSAFRDDDKDLYAFILGRDKIIPAIEEAVKGMKEGGVRRLIVPTELGYPNGDFNEYGPHPTTFSGQRALDFVLKNQGLIDKTLLFDVELVRVTPT